MEGGTQNLARIYRALGDENRLRILSVLRGGEVCACKLLQALNISQPTLSHHMKILCDCGLVSGRREGKWTHYSLCGKGSLAALAGLEALLEAAPDADCSCRGAQ